MTTHQDVQEFVHDWWQTNEQEYAERVQHREEVRRRAAENCVPMPPLEVDELAAGWELFRHQRNQLPVGVFLESVIPQVMNHAITTNQLGVVAEIGHDLLYAAICAADEQDVAEFFETAFGHWGPLITAAIAECDLRERCHRCGNVLSDSRRCEQEHD